MKCPECNTEMVAGGSILKTKHAVWWYLLLGISAPQNLLFRKGVRVPRTPDWADAEMNNSTTKDEQWIMGQEGWREANICRACKLVTIRYER